LERAGSLCSYDRRVTLETHQNRSQRSKITIDSVLFHHSEMHGVASIQMAMARTSPRRSTATDQYQHLITIPQ